MSNKYITIQEAAEISEKSVQTIRRALKSKKIDFKRSKTPQGFNYLISRLSLYNFYKIPNEEVFEVKSEQEKVTKEKTQKSEKISKADVSEVNENVESESLELPMREFKNFTRTLEKIMMQHSEERQSFLRLINTMQEKIFVLENQLNLLRSPKKKWYSFWK